MSTTRAALALLRGPVAARIRFTIPARGGGTITINRATFRQIAAFIEQGKIRIRPPTSLPPGAGASQNPANNEIQMRRPLGRWDEATIMHECLHGYFDVMKTSLSATDEEAAAYVVTALYCRMTGLKQDRWGQITQRARPLVDKLLKHYARGTPGIPAVDPDNWDELRMVVMTSPLYFNTAAGLPRQILPFFFGSGDYVNDG